MNHRGRVCVQIWAMGCALVLSDVSRAGCPVAVKSTQLEAKIDEALAQLEKLDIDAFRTQTDAIQGVVPCVVEPISGAIIAKLHRVNAIRAFGERASLAPEMFSAARRLDPDYVLPATIAPEGNPLWAAYNAIDPASRETREINPPTEGSVALDGEVTLFRHADWPTFAQVYDVDGGVAASGYVLPNEPLPAYPGSARFDKRKLRAPLIAATAASAIASGALYALAADGAARYEDTQDNPVPNEDLKSLKQRINGRVAGSIVTGAVATSAGVTLAVIW